jgi:hypothetical protein
VRQGEFQDEFEEVQIGAVGRESKATPDVAGRLRISGFEHGGQRMVKLSKKAVSKPGTTCGPNTLESITPSDAIAILKILAARSQNLAQEIDAVARELLGAIDVDEIAASVQAELESLQVEDVWDRSGSKRGEYLDPGDVAWEMFEEALRPFQGEVEKYKKLSMLREADLTYQGILRGIYDFHVESSTEYMQWAVDAPRDYFGTVLNGWQSLYEARLPIVRMTEFLQTHCPDWVEWATKSLRSREN